MKKLNAPYFSQHSRAHRVWVKFKRTLSMSAQAQGLADTIDGWVSGYEVGSEGTANEQLIGSLNVSIFLRQSDGDLKTHLIGRVSNIPRELRQQMTGFDENGKPVLKKEYYGRVVEIEAQDISSRALRGTHCRLIRWRPDRSPDSCILEESFLKSLIL